MQDFFLLVLSWAVVGTIVVASVNRRTLVSLWREPMLKRPVLIIESDDWGAGPLEQAVQLERIAGVLASHSNRLGQKPVMTLGIVLSIADGARIIADETRRYYRKRLDEPDFATVLSAIKRGAEADVFALQLHGEEHYWPPALLAAIRMDPQIATWLRSAAALETEKLPAHLQSRWIDAAELPSKPLRTDDIGAAASAEVTSFRAVFGYGPGVAVPPTFIWNEAVESGWAEAGVHVVVTPGHRYDARDSEGRPMPVGPAILNGDRSAVEMTYMVRDDYFEPARGHTAEHGLAALARKTRVGRPTLLETHRANFLGDVAVAEAAIRELDRLFSIALQRFPEVQFLPTEELALRMSRHDPNLVERRLGVRLHFWLRRLWEITRLRKLGWLTGAILPAWLVYVSTRPKST